jgi:hypothetical protein
LTALASAIDFDLRDGHRALVYVRSGGIRVCAGGNEQTIPAGHAVVLHGGGGAATLAALTARMSWSCRALK